MAFCAARSSPTEGSASAIRSPIAGPAFLPPNDNPARCLAKGKRSYELDRSQFYQTPSSVIMHHHHHHPSRREADDIAGFIALVEDGVCTQFKLVVPAGRASWSRLVHGLDIFCYETGVWTRLEIELPIPLDGKSLSKPVALGGKLHWPDYNEGVLLVYDPFRDDGDDEAQLVPLPDGRSSEVHSRMCGVSDEHLQYYEVAHHTNNSNNNVKVWELAPGQQQWLVKHQVSWNGVWSNDERLSTVNVGEPSDFFGFYPVAFHPFDSDVVYLHNRKYIISCNIRTQRLDVLCSKPLACFGHSFCWEMLPFVLPVWPTFPPPSFWEKDFFFTNSLV